MSRPTHQWCPSCREDSAVDRDLRCLWCGGETKAKRPAPRGPGSKLSDDHLRLLHRHHMAGRSLNELSKRIYSRVGYASPGSALMGILAGFKRLGLEVRSQPEATSLANRGRVVYEDSPGTADRAAYKQWWRRKTGRARRCKGLKSQPPGKGTRCTKWASPGSDFCRYHDPARREEVLEMAARMKAAA